MRLVAITSANKPSIAINAAQRAIRARFTPCMARPPEPRRPQRTDSSIPSIFGGEIGTGMRRVPAEFATRPSTSPPKSPNFLGVASQAAWIRVRGLITGTNSAQHDPAVVGRGGDAVIAGTAVRGATIELLRNGEPHDRAVANQLGQFVMVPPRLPPGDYELTLRSRQPNGNQAISRKSVAVAVH